jgi:hypothetical protein
VKTLLLTLVAATVLVGCAHKLTLTDFQNGKVIYGKAGRFSRSVSVTMPDGEILKGTYSAVTGGSISLGTGSATAFGTGGSATAFGSSTGYAIDGKGNAPAMLSSTRPGSKLMMEIVVSYSSMTGSGFGDAVTNDGQKFRVQF